MSTEKALEALDRGWKACFPKSHASYHAARAVVEHHASLLLSSSRASPAGLAAGALWWAVQEQGRTGGTATVQADLAEATGTSLRSMQAWAARVDAHLASPQATTVRQDWECLAATVARTGTELPGLDGWWHKVAASAVLEVIPRPGLGLVRVALETHRGWRDAFLTQRGLRFVAAWRQEVFVQRHVFHEILSAAAAGDRPQPERRLRSPAEVALREAVQACTTASAPQLMAVLRRIGRVRVAVLDYSPEGEPAAGALWVASRRRLLAGPVCLCEWTRYASGRYVSGAWEFDQDEDTDPGAPKFLFPILDIIRYEDQIPEVPPPDLQEAASPHDAGAQWVTWHLTQDGWSPSSYHATEDGAHWAVERGQSQADTREDELSWTVTDRHGWQCNDVVEGSVQDRLSAASHGPLRDFLEEHGVAGMHPALGSLVMEALQAGELEEAVLDLDIEAVRDRIAGICAPGLPDLQRDLEAEADGVQDAAQVARLHEVLDTLERLVDLVVAEKRVAGEVLCDQTGTATEEDRSDATAVTRLSLNGDLAWLPHRLHRAESSLSRTHQWSPAVTGEPGPLALAAGLVESYCSRYCQDYSWRADPKEGR